MKSLKFYKVEKIKAIAWLDSLIDSLKNGNRYIIEVTQEKAKRSLSANNYAWAMIDELAQVTHIGKTEIYRSYIKEIGGNVEVMRVEDAAVDMLVSVWEAQGLGWVTDTADSGYEGWTDVYLYYGSSKFDRAQMSQLIELIIQDCEEYGIETKEQAEINRLCEEWENG